MAAFSFAVVSLYWAVGGQVGLDTLGGSVEDRARAGDASLVVANWVAVVLKSLGAVLALALVQPWGRRVPRRLLLVGGWAGATLLVGYGTAQTLGALLMQLGVVRPSAAVEPEVLLWRLLLWEPWFLVWGLLLAATLRGVRPAARRPLAAGPRAPGVTAAPHRARLRASAGDYLVIAGGLMGLAVLAVGAAPLLSRPVVTSVAATDLVAFGFSVLPVWVYLTTAEAGRHQGTWAKRRAGLRVVTLDGCRPRPGRAGLRNAVKLAPWQLAHIAVVRLALEADVPVVTGTAYGLSLVLVVLTIALAVRDPQRRALHDHVAGTRVVAVGVGPR